MIALSTVITEKEIAEALQRIDMAMRDVTTEIEKDDARTG
jgi:hypothetical protein